METVQGAEPLSLSTLRMKGYNVLAGVSKQHQEKKQELPSAPGLLPRIPVPWKLMSSAAMNPASLADPIVDSSQIAPPPGLQPATIGDTPDNCAAEGTEH